MKWARPGLILNCFSVKDSRECYLYFIQSHFYVLVNTVDSGHNERQYADDILNAFFWNENFWISNKSSLKYIPWHLLGNISSLVQQMVWRQTGNEPLSELMIASTYWGRDKMAVILRMLLSNVFQCVEIVVFGFKSHWYDDVIKWKHF